MQRQEQPLSKRKAASEMEDNPLTNAVKRTKKDAKNASHKRKLLANAEPTRSGLFIVRESPFSPPESNSRESSATQQPSSSLPLKRNASSDLPRPPSKKARAGSQPPSSSGSTLKTKSTVPRPSPSQQRHQAQRSGSLPPTNGRLAAHHTTGFASITEEDERIEDDVRAMDAEADRLRRSSRVYLPESSSTTSTSIAFHPGQEKPRARSRSRGRVTSADTIQALPVDESPQIERNKRLREGAMNAIAATNGDDTQAETSRRGREREREPSTVNGHHRRKSSLSGRGKRISTSFEVGVIPQPHNSVSASSFYKHIDADLPDAERLRTLLIWSASRAAAKSLPPSSKPNSTASDNGQGSLADEDNPPPEPDLPPLSERAQQLLKNIQENVIRMLAERKIDLSLYSGDNPLPNQGEVPLKPNEQNVTNRILEVRYAEQIKRAQEEEEAWKRVSYHYDTFNKRQKEFLAKRTARMTPKEPPSSQTADDTPVDDSQPTTLSAKAKGKQRDMGIDDSWKAINEHHLPQDMQRGVRIARALMLSVQPSPSSSGKSPSPKWHKRGSNTPLPLPTPTLPDGELDLIGQALDDEVERRMHGVEFKIKHLLTCAHAARSMVHVAEELLNRWFELLNHNLASRANIQLDAPSTSSSSSAPDSSSAPTSSSDPSSIGGFLTKYVPRRLPPAGFAITGYEDIDDPSSSSSSSVSRIPIPSSSGLDPQDLFRALSFVDRKRPPGMVGDAARRAARDVARAGESGIGVIGERPVQKVPTTPRRGDRTIRRDRTPAR